MKKYYGDINFKYRVVVSYGVFFGHHKLKTARKNAKIQSEKRAGYVDIYKYNKKLKKDIRIERWYNGRKQ